MKTNEQIAELIQQHQFDSVRYAAIDRLNTNRADLQAWTFLGQAMVGLHRGKMAKLCFDRAVLLDPFANWVQQAWIDAENAGLGREDKKVLTLLEVPHVRVSACILTRDSARTIGSCIQALQGAVDEVIVVDTGSTDNTISIVESMGIAVHPFTWADDFSAARNYAMSLATSEWILSIDSDEFLYPYDRQNVHTVAALFYNDVFILNIFQMNQVKDSLNPFQAPRMFRKEYFTWKLPIHEQPVLLASAPVSIAKSQAVSIRVHHAGYDPNEADLRTKYERNTRILRRAIDEDPTQFGYYYYLGRALVLAKEYEEGINLLETAYEKSLQELGSPLLPEISEVLADAYVKTSRIDEAIQSLERITAKRPEHPNGWYALGLLLQNTEPDTAIEYLMKAKGVGLVYRGPSNFDAEISAWKADKMIEDIRTSRVID